MGDPKERPSPWPSEQPKTGGRLYPIKKDGSTPQTTIPLPAQDAALPLSLPTDDELDIEDDQ